MSHPDEGTIHAWLDGALDDAESAQLEAHLRGCAACGARVAEARGLIAGASRVLGALDDVPGGVIPATFAPAPDDDAEVAPTVVPIASRRAPAGARGIASRPLVRVAAAILVMAGGVALLQSRRAPEEASSVRIMEVAADSASVGPATAARGMAAAAPAAEEAVVLSQAATADAPASALPSALPSAPPSAPLSAPPSAPTAGVGEEFVGGMAAAASARGIAGGTARPAPPRDPSQERLAQVAVGAALERSERTRAIRAPLALKAAPDSLEAPLVEPLVVVGVVRDGTTGEPVEGASVLLDHGDLGTITDHLGRFTITGAKTGVHRAEVRRIGYASERRELRIGRDTAQLDVALAPAQVALNEVTVTGEAAGRAAANARSGRPGSRTERAPAAPEAPPVVAPAAPPPPLADSQPARPATAAQVRAAEVALATRARAWRGGRRAADAAGTCLVVTLRVPGEPTAEARTVTVRLAPPAADAEPALEFPRASEAMGDAAGSWSPVDTTGSERGLLRLRWTQGPETVTVRLPWGDAPMQGLAAVRIGGVGVDALASGTRVSCMTVR